MSRYAILKPQIVRNNNRLLAIEDEPGAKTARYAGFSAFYSVAALRAKA